MAKATLRSRKKAQQRQLLIEVAMRLFAHKKYENVRMEDIAAAGEVSTKTIYNYFGTKRDILIEYMVRSRGVTASEHFQAVLDQVSGDLVHDLIRLVRADIGDVATDGSKDLWLEIVAVSVRDAADDRFQRHRWMFTDYIRRLLIIYQSRGQFAADVDTRTAAHIIHLIYTASFIELCASPQWQVDDVVESLRTAFDQLFRRWHC